MGSTVRRAAPYGSEALLLELTGAVEPHVVAAELEAAGIGDERLCGWESVLVTGIDPDRADAVVGVVEQTTTGAATGLPPPARRPEVRLRMVADGEDLEEVAAIVSMSVGKVIEAFTAPTYRVVCLGFVRGFTYLDGLDPRLAALGRRATPRTSVPAGAVAIGGGQAGIYPTTSPGGWYLLGSTDAVLFDPERRTPCAFHPGDLVRFA